MKAKELRIGNFVLSENGQGKITTIEENRVSVDNDKLIYTPLDVIKPIKLTKEWLIDFGFEIDVWLWYQKPLDKLNILLANYKNGNVIAVEKGGKNVVNLRKLNHVNELQNLFFALTGQELEKQK